MISSRLKTVLTDDVREEISAAVRGSGPSLVSSPSMLVSSPSISQFALQNGSLSQLAIHSSRIRSPSLRRLVSAEAYM